MLLALGMTLAAVNTQRMQDFLAARFGNKPAAVYGEWRRLVSELRQAPDDVRLDRVNALFNRHIAFREDAELWGETDYWATPLETIGKLAGDCEDFTIAKYFTLVEAGVDPSRLRLTYVKARIGGPQSKVMQAHMVLTYYATPQAEPLVLDNLIGDIRPASRRPDLMPVFSFNRDGVYVGAAAPSPVERLSRWTNLLLRMREQGYDP